MAITQRSNEPWGFPATCTNISALANTIRAQQIEQANRLKLSQGMPDDAPVCHMHQQLLNAGAGGDPDDAELSLVDDPTSHPEILTRLTTMTVLVPQCKVCFLRSQGLVSDGSIPEDFDLCFCATMILSSSCAYCALSILRSKHDSAVAARTTQDVDGNDFLACECGSLFMLPADIGELVRKCVSCGGLVTAPFHNWLGDEVVFRKKTGDVVMVNLGFAAFEAVDVELATDLGSAEVDEASDWRLKGPPSLEAEATVSPDALIVCRRPPRPILVSSAPATHADVHVPQAAPNITKASVRPPRQPKKQAQPQTTSKPHPLREITNQAIPSRRQRLEVLGSKAGKMRLSTVSLVMRSFAFSDAETEKVLMFVTKHGLQEIEGQDLVAAIEKVLGRRLS